MIGYSKKTAKKYYHRVMHSGSSISRCGQAYTWDRFNDDQEDALRAEAPHLERCPRCWKGSENE